MQDLGPPLSDRESASVPKLLAGALIHRGELAALELGEAQAHGAVTVLFAALTGAFFLLGGFAATLAIAAAVWGRDDRALILAAVALGYAVVCAALGWHGYRRIKAWNPFAETRRVFHKDCAAARELTGSKDR